MPHLKYVYLPPGTTKSEVYDAFRLDMQNVEQLASTSMFLSVWRSDFPHLVIPKRITLGKCDKCCLYAVEKAAAKSVETRRKLKTDHSQHRDIVHKERNWINSIAVVASQHKDSYLFLCTDYMNPMHILILQSCQKIF